MRTIAFIFAILVMSIDSGFGNGSHQNDFPSSLSKYTFNDNNIQSGRLADLIIAGKQKNIIFLSKRYSHFRYCLLGSCSNRLLRKPCFLQLLFT